MFKVEIFDLKFSLDNSQNGNYNTVSYACNFPKNFERLLAKSSRNGTAFKGMV